MSEDQAPAPASKEPLYRRALQFEYFTVSYNLAEGVISVLAGVLTGSVALFGFGLDSFVETMSGSVMVWRLRKHGRITRAEEHAVEARATVLVGITFFVLAGYVFYEAGEKLWHQVRPEPNWAGMAIAVLSIAVMIPLYRAKYRIGRSIGSQSLVADAKETLACVVLSFVLLVGVGTNYFFGVWWTDPVAAVVIALYLVKEGWETVRGDED